MGKGAMARLAKQYNVPIKRGGLVRFGAKKGRILSVRRGYVRIRLDDGSGGPVHARETGLIYLDKDGSVLCDPSLCSKCKEQKPLYYHLCKECLPASYRSLIDG